MTKQPDNIPVADTPQSSSTNISDVLYMYFFGAAVFGTIAAISFTLTESQNYSGWYIFGVGLLMIATSVAVFAVLLGLYVVILKIITFIVDSIARFCKACLKLVVRFTLFAYRLIRQAILG